MRSFDDPEGQRWQVAPLDASYGQFALVFSKLHGQALRQRPMCADTLVAAREELAALSDDQLRHLLADTTPWP